MTKSSDAFGADGSAALSINQDAHLALEAVARSRAQPFGHFHVPVYALIDGPLRIDALEDAINAIIERHAILRTEFPDAGSLPRSLERAVLEKLVAADGWKRCVFSSTVRTNVGVSLTIRRTRTVSVETEMSAERPYFEEELTRPFSYTSAPLVRATLFQDGDRRHALLIVFHHLVADGWSVQVFLNELCEIYRCFVSPARQCNIPELSLQFADVAVWQRRLACDPATAHRLNAWQERYRRFAARGITFNDLPFLRPQRLDCAQGAAVHTIRFGPELSELMWAFCSRSRCTLYSLCLSALYALCHLHCGRNELAVWGAVRNRLADTEPLIGWLSEGRLLGVAVARNIPFSQFAREVRNTVVQAITDQYLPQLAIQHPSFRRPHPALHGSEAVHITLDVTNSSSAGALRLADDVGLVMSPVFYNRSTAPNIVRIGVDASADIRVNCSYDRSSVSTMGIQTLLQQLRALMAQCVGHPDRTLGSHEPVLAIPSTLDT